MTDTININGAPFKAMPTEAFTAETENTISEKYCKTLELDKILAMLAEYACCDYARERILNIKPSTNLRTVNDEISKTNDAFLMSASYSAPSFYRFTNPNEALKKASMGGALGTKQLLNIGTVLRQIRLLADWYKQCKDKETPLAELFNMLYPIKALEDRIEEVIISEDEISDYASPELLSIRRKIRSNTAKIRDSLNNIIRSQSAQKALRENIITMRDGRYVIPVKAEHRGSVNGLVHDTSASGATLFIEPMAVVEANNEIKVLQSKEKAEIEKILYELSAQAGENAQLISDNFETVISLNIYFAKSSLAAKMNASLPTVTDTGEIRLNKARHPLISKDKVVPIDVTLGKDYQVLLVTGPNTGGKTVTLKTIGLLTLMTMCGLLIPVSNDSVISVFNRVLVDIGDEQSIEQSLSTFSSHMVNIVSILKVADKDSLILLDELGSGTDPIEGASLAVAILEHLKEKQAIVAATTHYAELKVYALQTPGVQNACCEFDIKTLQPTYRLLVGVPGRSNALAISAKLGMPQSILDKAKEITADDKRNFEDVIEQLEASREEYERKSEECDIKSKQLAELEEQLKADMGDTLQKRDDIIAKAHLQAQTFVEEIKQQSQRLIDELDELRKQKDKEDFSKRELEARAALKGRLNSLHDKANPVIKRDNSDYVLPRPLKKGDTVLVVDIDKTGTVVDVSNNRVIVQTGIIKTNVSIDNIRLVKQQKTTFKGTATRSIESNRTKQVSLELDLRGLTVEEAIMDLDMYINKSLLTNVKSFTVIHGKGTGALRAAVHQHLKRCKQVKSYRLGVFGEGETGVTVVELK